MGEFNRRSWEAGKSGGHSPVGSTPGQPANMKDREAYWQGRAQAQWLKTPPTSVSPSPEPRVFSGGGARSGGSGASTAGKGAGAFVLLLIVIAIVASHGASDNKDQRPVPDQAAQGQLATPPVAYGSSPATFSNTDNGQTQTDQRGISLPAADQSATDQSPAGQEMGPSLQGGDSQSTPAPTVPTGALERGSLATGIAPPATSAAPAIPSRVFYATHKEGLGGGCEGTLLLSESAVQFDCSSEHFNFPIGAIAGPHKDGFVLNDGKKYHFHVSQESKDGTELLFSNWFQAASRIAAGQTTPGTEAALGTQP